MIVVRLLFCHVHEGKSVILGLNQEIYDAAQARRTKKHAVAHLFGETAVQVHIIRRNPRHEEGP